MAVLAPMPRTRARRATEVKPRFLSSSRRPKRTLRAKLFMPVPPKAPDDHSLDGLDVEWPELSRPDAQVLAIFVELALQFFWGREPPRRFKGAAEGGFSGGFQADVGGAAASPHAVTGIEDIGMGLDEHLLFNGNEFDHGPTGFGVAEGGEDFSGDTKIRVVHVHALFGFREAEGEAAKFAGSHRWPPLPGIVQEFLNESFEMRTCPGLCSSAQARQNPEVE